MLLEVQLGAILSKTRMVSRKKLGIKTLLYLRSSMTVKCLHNDTGNLSTPNEQAEVDSADFNTSWMMEKPIGDWDFRTTFKDLEELRMGAIKGIPGKETEIKQTGR